MTPAQQRRQRIAARLLSAQLHAVTLRGYLAACRDEHIYTAHNGEALACRGSACTMPARRDWQEAWRTAQGALAGPPCTCDTCSYCDPCSCTRCLLGV